MRPRARDRAQVAVRDLVISGVSVAAVGVLAHTVNWVLLAGAVGPTAYVFAAHPETETARLTNALVGHAAAIVIALGSLLCFGLWHQRLTYAQHPDLAHIASAAVAVGVTVFTLDLLDRHHAPAAASAVLVGSALIPPGRPVGELALALAAVSLVSSALAKLLARTRDTTLA